MILNQYLPLYITLILNSTASALYKMKIAYGGCPRNETMWKTRSRVFDCKTYTSMSYHCIRTTKNTLVEICFNPRVLRTNGYCPVFDTSLNEIIYSTCLGDPKGCPDAKATYKYVRSDQLYQYPSCLILDEERRNVLNVTCTSLIPTTENGVTDVSKNLESQTSVTDLPISSQYPTVDISAYSTKTIEINSKRNQKNRDTVDGRCYGHNLVCTRSWVFIGGLLIIACLIIGMIIQCVRMKYLGDRLEAAKYMIFIPSNEDPYTTTSPLRVVRYENLVLKD